MNERVREYEEQLIQAQNHIIYLENSRRPSSHADGTAQLESEISSLRETIARYTEHIEELNVEKENLQISITKKDKENS